MINGTDIVTMAETRFLVQGDTGLGGPGWQYLYGGEGESVVTEEDMKTGTYNSGPGIDCSDLVWPASVGWVELSPTHRFSCRVVIDGFRFAPPILRLLAGALGKPVWVLLNYAPYWMWGEGRQDGSWYDSVKLFWQRGWGDWNGAFDACVNSQFELVSNNSQKG